MNEKQSGFPISRRGLLQALAAAACSASLPNFARGLQAPPREGPAFHNWMLVGSQTAFLSHLPMFEMLNPAGTDPRARDYALGLADALG